MAGFSPAGNLALVASLTYRERITKYVYGREDLNVTECMTVSGRVGPIGSAGCEA